MSLELRARFPDAAYIDPTARMFGRVEIGAGSSLWPMP
jgi:carbonic anhydrase/acetyltransferase-like protein (isoleucine patch superfamily)